MASDFPSVSTLEARRFLKTLGDGVPPRDKLTVWLTVGEEPILREFSNDLERTTNGEFRTLLVLGNPGAGKSHLLTAFQYLAAERGFVTAYFSQDLDSRLAFNRPDQIYRRIMETMRLPANSGADTDSLRVILDRWVDLLLPRLGNCRRSMQIAYRLGELGLLPNEVEKIHPRTRVALVGYVMACEQQNEEAKRDLLGVLRGPGLESRELIRLIESVNLTRKGFIGYTPSPYDAAYYFGQLCVLVFIMRSVGFKGMLTLFDEVTAIVDLGSRSREKAYKVLDSLFLNNYQYRGLYTVFAYMPPFITQLRSDASTGDSNYINRWRPVLEGRVREILPLSQTQQIELIRRIAQLHGKAHDWQAEELLGGDIEKLVKDGARASLSTRDLVRMSVEFLEETLRKRSK